MKKNKPKTGVSVIATLAEIKDFVRWCKKQDGFAGINVHPGRSKGFSYIIGKTCDSLQPKFVLPISMDYVNPIERPLIANAIHEAMYGESMSPESMEDEMICKADPL